MSSLWSVYMSYIWKGAFLHFDYISSTIMGNSVTRW